MPSPIVASPAAGSGTSLYVHVPFCAVKCGYCDFNSYVVDDLAVHDRFLAALDAELRLSWRAANAPVSVFIGGGTPSRLDAQRFAAMFEVLTRHVDLRGCPEVTMEANPESITQQKVETARAAGVNRISIGVQSFHDDVLRFLDRPHDAARVRAAVGEVRAGGIDNFSLDLIFSVPGQSLSQWQDDLAVALELEPAHLSCYSLTYEPGTRLTHALDQGRVVPTDEDTDRAMFVCTRETLGGAGFEAYEISNFAGRGGPCRHNDHYWLQGDYVGTGPGASSHRAGVRGTNLKPVESWARAALAGLPPTASAETLSPRQRAGEAVWLGIRRRDGVDLAAIEARLRMPVRSWFADTVNHQLELGLVAVSGDRLCLSDEGLLFADRVGAAFLQ